MGSKLQAPRDRRGAAFNERTRYDDSAHVLRHRRIAAVAMAMAFGSGAALAQPSAARMATAVTAVLAGPTR